MNEKNYAYVLYRLVEGETKNLRTVLLRYARSWPWFLVSVAVVLVGAYIYLLFQPPIYKVQASLLVKDEEKGIDGDNMLKELDSFTPRKVVENEIDIRKSYTLIDKIVTQMQLATRYYTKTSFGQRETFTPPVWLVIEQPQSEIYQELLTITFPGGGRVRINDVAYPLNQSIRTPYGRLRVFSKEPVKANTELLYVDVQPQSDAVRGFLKSLKAEPTSKASSVMRLTLEDAVPKRGEVIVNQ